MHKSPVQQGAGIGSLPHHDVQTACSFIKRHLPQFPHWPQLPQLGDEEGFVEQFLAPLQTLGLIKKQGKGLVFAQEEANWAERITQFYQLYLDDADQQYFALPPERGQGLYALVTAMDAPVPWVKGQISGPVTVGMQITDSSGKAAYYDDQLRDILVKNLVAQARWQVQQLAKLAAGVVLTVDDPSIYLCGQSTHITLNKTQIQQDLSELYEAIHTAGALAGTHACAGADWSILLETDLDIISFDAYNYFETLLPYDQQINSFLAQGGVLAWGIVPTSKKIWHENAESLLNRLRGYFERLIRIGVKSDLLWENWLVTPSCGTGLLSLDEAERIYQLTIEVAEALKGKK